MITFRIAKNFYAESLKPTMWRVKLVSLRCPLRALLHLIVISGAVYLECNNKEIVIDSSTEKLASLSSHKSQPGTSPSADSPSSSSAGSSEDVNSQSSSSLLNAPPGERDTHMSSPSDVLLHIPKDGAHAPWPVRLDGTCTPELLDFYDLPSFPRGHSRRQSDPGQPFVNASATPSLDKTIYHNFVDSPRACSRKLSDLEIEASERLLSLNAGATPFAYPLSDMPPTPLPILREYLNVVCDFYKIAYRSIIASRPTSPEGVNSESNKAHHVANDGSPSFNLPELSDVLTLQSVVVTPSLNAIR
jgi:hypothetical protein